MTGEAMRAVRWRQEGGDRSQVDYGLNVSPTGVAGRGVGVR
jgi:hypothetical protein